MMDGEPLWGALSIYQEEPSLHDLTLHPKYRLQLEAELRAQVRVHLRNKRKADRRLRRKLQRKESKHDRRRVEKVPPRSCRGRRP